MKKILFILMGISLLSFGAAYAKQVRDWKDLDKVHNHVNQAIHEMENARRANHYDMDGHGEKAEAALHEAEHELAAAIQSSRATK